MTTRNGTPRAWPFKSVHHWTCNCGVVRLVAEPKCERCDAERCEDRMTHVSELSLNQIQDLAYDLQLGLEGLYELLDYLSKMAGLPNHLIDSMEHCYYLIEKLTGEDERPPGWEARARIAKTNGKM